MNGLQCSVVLNGHLATLCQNAPGFSILKCSGLIPGRGVIWNRGGKTTEDIQIVVMGKTGYGKSTLLNRLVGSTVFRTSDTEACTRRMESADFVLPYGQDQYFSLADLPGIGENPERDREYIDLYRKTLGQASLIVYVVRADQRDLSKDEWAFNELFRTPFERSKVLIALNAVDKIEPLSRVLPFRLSSEQLGNLERRIGMVSRALNIPESQVVPVSAEEGYGMINLVERMMQGVQPLLSHL